MNKVPIAYMLSAMMLALGLLMPLHVLPWVSWSNEWPVFVCIAGVAFSMLGRFIRRAWPIAQIFPGVMGLVVILQGLAGIIPFAGDAVILWVYVWAFAVAMQAGFHVREVRLATIILAISLCLVATLSTLVAMFQAFGGCDGCEWVNRMPLHRRPGANVGQPNQLSTLLAWGLVSLAYLWTVLQQSQVMRHVRIAFHFILYVLLFGAALTESRTGLISITLLYACWILARWRGLYSWQKFQMCVPFGFYWISIWLVPKLLHIVWQEEGGALDAGLNLQTGTRPQVWLQLWQAAMMKPWLGWGLRNVSEAHNAVLDHYTFAEPFTYAHNIVLDMAVGMGLPLTLLVVLMVGAWVFFRMRVATGNLVWYCFALLFPLMVHSMLEFPFSYAYFLIPAGFVIGIIERGTTLVAACNASRYFMGALTLCATTLMAGVAWEYVQVEEDFRVARFEALRVGQTPQEYTPPKLHFLTQLDAMLFATRAIPRPGMTTAELELLRKAAVRFPWTAIQGRYALALALNGNVPEAQRQLKVIRALYGEKMLQTFREQWRKKSIGQYPQLQGVADF